ncbi:methyl-accepting chemotaxis protein [Sphingomonas sp. R1]|uniref:methyl-accepting chemotaxis protein n=1 Tax=Sphingomonas sp. R1 TaxID=399176 RepID=UPI00222404F4|nr:methyl-accepting chemotaxis protein [Sphingomonas sp. R1]UYY79175.1 methyl-accepting chemotaxis protein [Sphingomonas sp. R1]
MTIKQKLLGCLALFGIATLLLIGVGYWSARSSERALSTLLTDRVLPLHDLKIVADRYAVQIVDTAHKARNGNIGFAEAASNVAAGSAELHKAWAAYRQTEIAGEESRVAAEAEARMQLADRKVDRLHAILRAGDAAALDGFVRHELYPAIDPVSESINRLVDLQIKISEEVANEARGTAGFARLSMAALGLLAGAVLVVSFLTITHKVIAPIRRLAKIIAELARSSGETTLPHLEQQDEIGDITRSVDGFLKSAIAKERDRADAAAAEQTTVTTALRDSLAALKAGDLTRPVTAAFPAAYAELKSNFNEALDNLRTLIGTVIQSAQGISTGSKDIAQASEDLARRTESTAASLAETAASIGEIDGRLKATAAAASNTVERANGAIHTVEGGRAITDEAVRAMSRVADSAKGIDGVIEGLDKIAFQTRVLAMNAAVEAGRAGEAGRGFAVVADLVSALAMRAEEEAKRARDQLTVTQSEIGTAVDAVQKVDGALSNIAQDVAQVHQLLGGMATDNNAQAAAIVQVTTAVHTMDSATQQNAAMVEETSAAARNLSNETRSLSDQASRFRVADSGGTSLQGKFATPAEARPLPVAAVRAMTRDVEDWQSF